MQKSYSILGLILLSTILASAQTPAQPVATLPSDENSKAHAQWYKECAGRVAAIKGNPCDIIFIGDSITQNFQDEPPSGWDLVGGNVWKKYYGDRHALDFGVGADGTEHVLWRLDHMDIKDFKPTVTVILNGTNDTQFGAEDMAAGVKAVVTRTLATFAGVTFGNDKTVYYFDLGAEMTPVGDNWKGVGYDHLHLTPDRYE
jgi:hypothetical protein